MIRRAAYINHGFDLVVFESVLPGRSGRLFFSRQCESDLSCDNGIVRHSPSGPFHSYEVAYRVVQRCPARWIRGHPQHETRHRIAHTILSTLGRCINPA